MLSRYYSPVPWQKKYLSDVDWYIWKKYTDKYKANWYTQGYERDVCMNCWCRLDWKEKQLYDCTIPADWLKLTDDDIHKAVACPSEYKLGTKIYLKDIWTVVCRDRGWAIKNNRLDMWCWIWEKALDNWDNCPTWNHLWHKAG